MLHPVPPPDRVRASQQLRQALRLHLELRRGPPPAAEGGCRGTSSRSVWPGAVTKGRFRLSKHPTVPRQECGFPAFEFVAVDLNFHRAAAQHHPLKLTAPAD